MNLSERANERLNDILAFAAGDDGDLRTFLDEWAAFTEGNELVKRTGSQRWFNNPCPHEDGARLLAHMNWHTPGAREVLLGGVQKRPEYKKPPTGHLWPYRIIVDHAVPIKVLGEEMRRRSLQRKDELLAFLASYYKRGVLLESENKLLNQAGLRQCMPEGWDGLDPFARYHAIGLLCA